MSGTPSSAPLPSSQSTRPRPRPTGTTDSTSTGTQMPPPRSVPPAVVSDVFTANSSLESSAASVSVVLGLLSDDTDSFASLPLVHRQISRYPGEASSRNPYNFVAPTSASSGQSVTSNGINVGPSAFAPPAIPQSTSGESIASLAASSDVWQDGTPLSWSPTP